MDFNHLEIQMKQKSFLLRLVCLTGVSWFVDLTCLDSRFNLCQVIVP